VVVEGAQPHVGGLGDLQDRDVEVPGGDEALGGADEGRPRAGLAPFEAVGGDCDEFAQAGFFIDRLLEPQPQPEAAEIDPKTYRDLMELPAFIAFRLRKRAGV
jgi:hypothetical protein